MQLGRSSLIFLKIGVTQSTGIRGNSCDSWPNDPSRPCFISTKTSYLSVIINNESDKNPCFWMHLSWQVFCVNQAKEVHCTRGYEYTAWRFALEDWNKILRQQHCHRKIAKAVRNPIPRWKQIRKSANKEKKKKNRETREESRFHHMDYNLIPHTIYHHESSNCWSKYD